MAEYAPMQTGPIKTNLFISVIMWENTYGGGCTSGYAILAQRVLMDADAAAITVDGEDRPVHQKEVIGTMANTNPRRHLYQHRLISNIAWAALLEHTTLLLDKPRAPHVLKENTRRYREHLHVISAPLVHTPTSTACLHAHCVLMANIQT